MEAPGQSLMHLFTVNFQQQYSKNNISDCPSLPSDSSQIPNNKQLLPAQYPPVLQANLIARKAGKKNGMKRLQ